MGVCGLRTFSQFPGGHGWRERERVNIEIKMEQFQSYAEQKQKKKLAVDEIKKKSDKEALQMGLRKQVKIKRGRKRER